MTEREIIVREFDCEVCDGDGYVCWVVTAPETRMDPEESEAYSCGPDEEGAEPCPNEEHPSCFGCGERLYGRALVCDDWNTRGRAVGICETASCALEAIRNLDHRVEEHGPSSAAIAELVGSYYWRAAKRGEK